eukprot:5767251-Pyramimonas_sp.AAC.1
MDTLENGHYDLKFTEANDGADSIWKVFGGYRNVAFWDGVAVAVSEARPALELGETRSVGFPNGIPLPLD